MCRLTCWFRASASSEFLSLVSTGLDFSGPHMFPRDCRNKASACVHESMVQVFFAVTVFNRVASLPRVFHPIGCEHL